MQIGALFILPGPLDDRCFCEIKYLLHYIQFNQTIRSPVIILQQVKFGAMNAIHIFNIPEPHIQHWLEIMISDSSFYPPASIMSANDHMLYLEMIHSIVEHT